MWVPQEQIEEFRALFPGQDNTEFTNWKEDRKIAPEHRRAVTVHFGKTGYQKAETSGKPYMDRRTGQLTMWADSAAEPPGRSTWSARSGWTSTPRRTSGQPLPSGRTTGKE